MRRLRALSLAVATLSAGLVLTACGGGSNSDSASVEDSASGTPSLTTAPGSTADGSTPAAGAPATTGSGDSASAGAPANSGTGSGGSAGGGRCHTAGLSFSVAPGSGAQSVGSPGAVIIKMTNQGSDACTIQGYPGVDLVGGSTTWSLARQTSQTPHAVTVKPGGSTDFTITYMPYAAGSGQSLDVKTVVITPPNETTSAKVAWDFQSVLLQDGATHPATYVGPVGGK
jgi:hypothetical protein